jgi:hypothetical protein
MPNKGHPACGAPDLRVYLRLMTKPILISLLFLLILPACDRREPIPAEQMLRSLGQATFRMNKAINTGEVEEARRLSVAGVEDELDKVFAGFAEGRYNLLMSPDEGKINFQKATAVVTVNAFKGTYTGRMGVAVPDARIIEKQKHHWKFEDGRWRWAGFSL